MSQNQPKITAANLAALAGSTEQAGATLIIDETYGFLRTILHVNRSRPKDFVHHFFALVDGGSVEFASRRNPVGDAAEDSDCDFDEDFHEVGGIVPGGPRSTDELFDARRNANDAGNNDNDNDNDSDADSDFALLFDTRAVLGSFVRDEVGQVATGMKHWVLKALADGDAKRVLFWLEESWYGPDESNVAELIAVRASRDAEHATDNLARIYGDIFAERKKKVNEEAARLVKYSQAAAKPGLQAAPRPVKRANPGARAWRFFVRLRDALHVYPDETIRQHMRSLAKAIVDRLFKTKMSDPEFLTWPVFAAKAESAKQKRLTRRFKLDDQGTVGYYLREFFEERLATNTIVTKSMLFAKARKLFEDARKLHTKPGELLDDSFCMPAGWTDRWIHRNSIRAFSISRRIALPEAEIRSRIQSLHDYVDRLYLKFPGINIVINFDQIPFAEAGGEAKRTYGFAGQAPHVVEFDHSKTKRCGSLFAIHAAVRGADGEWRGVRFPWAFLMIGADSTLPTLSQAELAGWCVWRNTHGVVDSTFMENDFWPWLHRQIDKVCVDEHIENNRHVLVFMDSASGHISRVSLIAFYRLISDVPPAVLPGGTTQFAQLVDVYSAGALRQRYRTEFPEREADARVALALAIANAVKAGVTDPAVMPKPPSKQQRLNNMIRLLIYLVEELFQKNTVPSTEIMRALGYFGTAAVKRDIDGTVRWHSSIADLHYNFGHEKEHETTKRLKYAMAGNVEVVVQKMLTFKGTPLISNFFKKIDTKPQQTQTQQDGALTQQQQQTEHDGATQQQQQTQQQQGGPARPPNSADNNSSAVARQHVAVEAALSAQAAKMKAAEELVRARNAKFDEYVQEKRDEMKMDCCKDKRSKKAGDAELKADTPDDIKKRRAVSGRHKNDCEVHLFRQYVEEQKKARKGTAVAGAADVAVGVAANSVPARNFSSAAQPPQTPLPAANDDGAVALLRDVDDSNFVRTVMMSESVIATVVQHSLEVRGLSSAVGFVPATMTRAVLQMRDCDAKRREARLQGASGVAPADAATSAAPELSHEADASHMIDISVEAAAYAKLQYVLLPLCYNNRFLLVAFERAARTACVYDSFPGGYMADTREEVVSAVLDDLRLSTITAHCKVTFPAGFGIQRDNTNDCGLFAIQNALVAAAGWFPDTFQNAPALDFTDGSNDRAHRLPSRRVALESWFKGLSPATRDDNNNDAAARATQQVAQRAPRCDIIDADAIGAQNLPVPNRFGVLHGVTAHYFKRGSYIGDSVIATVVQDELQDRGLQRGNGVNEDAIAVIASGVTSMLLHTDKVVVSHYTPAALASFRATVADAVAYTASVKKLLLPLCYGGHFILVAADRVAGTVSVFDSFRGGFITKTREEFIACVLRAFGCGAFTRCDDVGAGVQPDNTNDCALFVIQNALEIAAQWFPASFANAPCIDFTDRRYSSSGLPPRRATLETWYEERVERARRASITAAISPPASTGADAQLRETEPHRVTDTPIEAQRPPLAEKPDAAGTARALFAQPLAAAVERDNNTVCDDDECDDDDDDEQLNIADPQDAVGSWTQLNDQRAGERRARDE
jgi:hypothetical protein